MSHEKNPQTFPTFVLGIRENGAGPDGSNKAIREEMFNLGVHTAVNVVPHIGTSIRAKRS